MTLGSCCTAMRETYPDRVQRASTLPDTPVGGRGATNMRLTCPELWLVDVQNVCKLVEMKSVAK